MKNSDPNSVNMVAVAVAAAVAAAVVLYIDRRDLCFLYCFVVNNKSVDETNSK